MTKPFKSYTGLSPRENLHCQALHEAEQFWDDLAKYNRPAYDRLSKIPLTRPIWE